MTKTLLSALLLAVATPAAGSPARPWTGIAVEGIVQEHVAPAESLAAEAGHGQAEPEHGAEADGATEHAEEEWGPSVMMHHVGDSHEIEFFRWTIHLPEWEPIVVGGVAIDLSPTKHTVFLWVATLLTILTVWYASRKFSGEGSGKEAPRGFQNVFETFYEYLRDEVAMANIGHGGERFVPYVVTLFFFILYANLLGMIPFGATATGNIMVTGALAIISFVIVEVSGYVALGPRGYMRTIFFIPDGLHPIMKVVMFVIMPVVELIGKLAKPFALAVRLFANMTAGHFVILALLGLILAYGGATAIGGVSIVGALALATFVMFLELFVAFLQAYIFTVLTAVFIGLIRHAH